MNATNFDVIDKLNDYCVKAPTHDEDFVRFEYKKSLNAMRARQELDARST